ncbi:hypothetical protein [Bacillus marinisedimentorum]|uniref:hypothetical protein n=1 Tax=Bacillus marinisedimentorum TaxID=1821260 RepID=UPI00087231DB|nr:hypothetical protein [Bacillus marinisedimentorum]
MYNESVEDALQRACASLKLIGLRINEEEKMLVRKSLKGEFKNDQFFQQARQIHEKRMGKTSEADLFERGTEKWNHI